MIPPGYKLIAWEGAGLYVPDRWDLGRYWGDHLHGGFRVDNETRPTVEVRWWKTRGEAKFEPALRQHVPAFSRKRDREPVELRRVEVPLSAVARGRAAVYDTPADAAQRERVIVWQTEDQKRAAMFRILTAGGQPDAGMMELMCQGLRLQTADEPRDWAVYELRMTTPAGWLLDEASLAVGVCRFAFRAGKRRVTLRRFSAADAVIGSAAFDAASLERWLRAVYAAEFFGMRYDVSRTSGGVVLQGQRRLLRSIEWSGLLPHFRRDPRRIDVAWDDRQNKVWCIEMDRAMDVDSLASSVAFQPSTSQIATPADASPRAASLAARVRRSEDVRESVQDGRVRLQYALRRTRRLQALRVLAGQPAESVQQRTTDLDPMGAALWRACDDMPRVSDLIEQVMLEQRISYREAELSVTHYVRWLGERGLLRIGRDDAR